MSKQSRFLADIRERWPKPARDTLPEGALGPLEAEIMQVVWANDAVTTRDVREELAKRRNIAYTTVMTVMGNLTRKGLLARHMQGKAYVYEATTTEADLARSHVAKVIGPLLDRFAEPAISYLIGKLDTIDPATLAELEAEVSRLRRQLPTRQQSSGEHPRTGKSS